MGDNKLSEGSTCKDGTIKECKISKKIVIVLDPGHGDLLKGGWNDPGVIVPGEKKNTAKYQESLYALKIAFAVYSEFILDSKYSVIMTRYSDNKIVEKKINWRWKLANDKEAKIFISFHLNSGKSEEVFIIKEPGIPNFTNSGKLADKISNELKTVVKMKNPAVILSSEAAVKTLGVLKYFRGEAGILFEFGAIASDAIRNKIDDPKILTEIAKAIKKGIDNYAL